MKKIKSSVCICIYEPRGDNGLEGYCLNTKYFCQFIENVNNTYWKLYPTPSDDNYYEMCSPIIFKRYFKEL